MALVADILWNAPVRLIPDRYYSDGPKMRAKLRCRRMKSSLLPPLANCSGALYGRLPWWQRPGNVQGERLPSRRRSNLPAEVPVEPCPAARSLEPSMLDLHLSIAFPLSKLHPEDAPAGAAPMGGGHAPVLPLPRSGTGRHRRRTRAARRRRLRATAAAVRAPHSGQQLRRRPGGRYVLGLRCGLQPTPELAGSGPVPAFGARRGFGWRRRADAKDRDVDGEERHRHRGFSWHRTTAAEIRACCTDAWAP